MATKTDYSELHREMNRELDEIAARMGITWGPGERTSNVASPRHIPGSYVSAKPMPVKPTAPTASEKQINFINKLIGERDATDIVTADEVAALSVREASNIITRLLAAPRKPAAAPERKTQAQRVTEDGMYRTADGTIYKVQIAKNGSGHLYAKVLDVETQSFGYAPGAINKLTADDRMSLADAAEFGKLYGFCCVCARDLTDEESISLGIGPICRKRF